MGALPPILPIAAHHPKPSPLALAHAGTHLSSSPPSAIPSGASESPHPTLNSPPSQYCAPFPPPTTRPFPHMAVPRGRPSPRPTRTILYLPLSFRGSARNLPTPRSTPLNPITVRHSHRPTHSPFPRRGAPRGRPPPHPTHCRAPSYTSPKCHSERSLGISPPHSQRPSIPLLCAIPATQRAPLPPHGRPPWAPFPPSYPLPRTILYLPLSFRGSARNLTAPRSTPLHPITMRHSHRSPHYPSPVGVPLVDALPPPVVLAHAGTHPPWPWPRVTLSTAEPKNLAAPLATPLHPFIY